MKFGIYVEGIIGKDGGQKDAVLSETSNADVMAMFIDDSFPKDKRPVWGTDNLKITKENNGWSLVNYRTRLMYRPNEGTEGLFDDRPVFFNTEKYSITTSKIQNQIRGMAESKKVKLTETDEDGINAEAQK